MSRLPQAFETYSHWLREQGRADELEMSPDQKFDAQLDGRWFGPKDSTWTEVHRTMDFPGSGLAVSFPGRTDWQVLDPKLLPKEEYECQEMSAARFEISAGETLLFTVGHAMEGCTDDPFMVWPTGEQHLKGALPDLFGYNVQGLWYSGEYLIFNIRVEYEYGGTYEGFAFWHLEEGWLRSIVAETHVGYPFGDDPPRKDPKQGLGVYLRDLAGVTLNESDRVVYVNTGKVRLVFWPERLEWMVVQ